MISYEDISWEAKLRIAKEVVSELIDRAEAAASNDFQAYKEIDAMELTYSAIARQFK